MRDPIAVRQVGARKELENTSLEFTLTTAGWVRLEVDWDGSADAAADWMLIIFAERPELEWQFEVEDLHHAAIERPDAEASGAWGVGVRETAGRIIATRTVHAGELSRTGYREVAIDFQLGNPAVLEFPIWHVGPVGVFLDRLRVVSG
jgi:hypothetical protein